MAVTKAQWARDLLQALPSAGLLNPKSVACVVAWQIAEGNGGRNNPLNTTLAAGAIGSINADGVKDYPTKAAGIHATVVTLRMPAYSDIRKALSSGNTSAFADAVAASPWGTTSADIHGAVASVLANPKATFNQPANVDIGSSSTGGGADVLPGGQNYDPLTGAPVAGISSVVDFLKMLANPQNWLRALYVIGGAILIAIAAVMVVRKQVL